MKRLLMFVVLVAACDVSGIPLTPEAGACHVVCDGPEPYCGPLGECVACLENVHCPSATPVCDATGTCISECETDANCPTPEEPTCSSHVCVATCTDSGCARFASTPTCDEASGRCVACTEDSEIVRCGGNACRPDFTCGQHPRESRDVCQSCTSDAECAAGRSCIVQSFGGAAVGSYCMLERPVGGCGDVDAAVLPYSSPVETTSVDGATGTFCLLSATVTCEAVADRGLPCTADSECGVDGVSDGICRSIMPRKCTYACASASDCASGVACLGVPAVCQP